VTLRLETSSNPVEGDEVEVSAEVWVQTERAGVRDARYGGQTTFGSLTLGQDPTKALVDLGYLQREMNLGSAFGDARRAGRDVTRFECYSAPFCIELEDSLRAVLSGTWDERDPRG